MRASVTRGLSVSVSVAAVLFGTSLSAGPKRPPIDPARAKAAKHHLEMRDIAFDAEHFAGKVRAGDFEAVQFFLDAGIDPDVGDGDTPPLNEAATRGKTEVARLLLDFGADPNKKDGNGETPLQAAVSQRQADVIRALVDAGANPNIAFKGSGEPPIVRAAQVSCKPCVLALLDGGADPNRGDQNGSTAVLTVAQTGDAETIKALLAKGADPNVHAAGGGTALLLAVAMDKVDVAKALLEGGANFAKEKTVLVASAHSPEMKKLLANPPAGKKPAAKKGGAK